VAGLFIVALVKPTVSAPFFWLVLFLPGRLRPAALVLLGYLAVTLVAASFQESSLPALLQGWRRQESQMAFVEGHTNLSKWLAVAGLEEALVPAALLTLLGLGVLAWRYRGVDFWLLAGIMGVATRLWVHHRGQDDLLILLPMIALLRLAKQSPSPARDPARDLHGRDVKAGLLFALTWMTMLAPVDLLLRFPASALLTHIWMGVLWITTLLFLLGQARQERSKGPRSLPGERLKPMEVAAGA